MGYLSDVWSAIKGKPETVERNSITSAYNGGGITSWESFLYGANSLSNAGEEVNGNTSWRVSAVYRCIAAIAETVATLPFFLQEIDDNGNKRIAEKHITSNIYGSEPNEYQTWFEFKAFLMSQALTYGNGYALIKRDLYGKPTAYKPLTNSECVPYYVNNGLENYLYYHVFGKITQQRDIIHIKCIGHNGVIGRSLIEIARDGIGTSLAQQAFGGAMYKNGLNLQGFLEHPATLSNEAQVRLKKQMDVFKGAKNASGTMLLEEGLTYKGGNSLRPVDAQFIESRKFAVEDIARFYGVPLHKIGELAQSTNNNIEQQDLEFYKNTILPWEERIEQEFDRKILLLSERKRYKHEFDNSKLLRADTKARQEWITSMFNKGAVTPNEVRTMEGFNKIENKLMDETYMQGAMATIDNLKNYNEQNREQAIPV